MHTHPFSQAANSVVSTQRTRGENRTDCDVTVDHRGNLDQMKMKAVEVTSLPEADSACHYLSTHDTLSDTRLLPAIIQ